MNELLSADFLKFFVPLVGAVVAWFVNEHRRRASDEYQRKEERYRELLRAMTGFYAHSSDAEVRRQFIEEYKRCWLYCDDEVIRAANAAMAVMVEGTTVPMERRLHVLGDFVLTLRRDLLRRKVTRKTALAPDDYVHIAHGK